MRDGGERSARHRRFPAWENGNMKSRWLQPRYAVRQSTVQTLATIKRYEGVTLTDPRDREAFVTAMLKPRAPSHTLEAAAARYRAATRHR